MSKEDTEFWYGLIFGFGAIVVMAVILIVVLMQVGAFTRYRIARREDARDQELIAKYEQLAAQTRDAQQTAATELTGLRQRLEAVERLLREVE